VFSVLLYPDFNPVLVHLGPFAIRWYALAYITGLVLGWRLMRRLVLRTPDVATPLQVDDFLTWATLGVVLGGRLGYVLFYQPAHYFAHPVQIFEVWDGGMSFHGGMLGVGTAIAIFCRRNGIPMLGFADRIAVCAPIGLGLGRIANFINGELWGRPAPLSWPGAMVFPRAIPVANPSLKIYQALSSTVCAGLAPDQCVPRYPSELYEAFMEGLVLLIVMLLLARKEWVRTHFGWLTGAFLVGYAIARSTCEFFRAPDFFLRFLVTDIGLSMGQILCIPMLIGGIWLLWYASRHPVAPAR
jgi:phosphatidylglycerol---prolipoprotein diacylglyceryl transferase